MPTHGALQRPAPGTLAGPNAQLAVLGGNSTLFQCQGAGVQFRFVRTVGLAQVQLVAHTGPLATLETATSVGPDGRTGNGVASAPRRSTDLMHIMRLP